MTTERLKELKRLAENYQPALSRMEVDKSELLALIAAVESMKPIVDAARDWNDSRDHWLAFNSIKNFNVYQTKKNDLRAAVALSREGVSNG